jgi:hypothetical protein
MCLLERYSDGVTAQLHWKPPSAKFTGYRFHQDLRFRERPELYSNLDRTYLNTGLAIDPHGPENGGLASTTAATSAAISASPTTAPS